MEQVHIYNPEILYGGSQELNTYPKFKATLLSSSWLCLRPRFALVLPFKFKVLYLNYLLYSQTFFIYNSSNKTSFFSKIIDELDILFLHKEYYY